MSTLREAPQLTVSDWLNTDHAIDLNSLRGRVVMIEAFQMLCSGCVSYGLPQAQSVHEMFAASEVTVLGLHSVFEAAQAQGSRSALEAFVRAQGLTFPIAIDALDVDGMPLTMQAYGMQGTPTLVLIDAAGRKRMQKFGHVSDAQLRAAIAALVREE